MSYPGKPSAALKHIRWDGTKQVESDIEPASPGSGDVGKAVVVTAAGTYGLGAAVGGGPYELLPMELDFHEVAGPTAATALPILMGSLVHDEEFTDPTLTRFTIVSEISVVSTPSISAGQITISYTAGQNIGLIENTAADLAVPQFATQMHIASITSSGGSYANCGVGYTDNTTNFILAVWQKASGQASIQVKIGGSSNMRGTVSVSWTPPFDIALTLVGNSLCMWQRPNGGNWTFVTSYGSIVADTGFNFKSSSLTGWKPSFWFASDSTANPTTVVYSAHKTGLFGGVGIRDLSVANNLDGSIYFSGGSNSVVTFLATLTDPAAAGYCGVLTYDLNTRVLTQVGWLFVSRGGAIQNDSSGQLILVGDGTFHLFLTTWGNAGTGASNINILYKHETSLNLLTGVNVVGSMTQPTLPNIPSGGGTYDPSAVLISGTWYLGYTIGPNASLAFYPAMASSTNLTAWTQVGQGVDLAAVPYEGTIINKLAGSFWLLAASSQDTIAYDLTFTRQGRVRTPVQPYDGNGIAHSAAFGLGSYPPHPMMVPFGEFIYQLTFDNKSTYSTNVDTAGNIRIYRARRFGTNG